MSNRLALFDCDGTLVDSQHNIVEAMADAFAQCGFPAPGRAATLRIVGLSLFEAMAVLLPGGDRETHARLAESYRTAFRRLRGGGLIEEPLYEGITDALAALKRAGWLLGVVTGKSDRGLSLCLSHHGITERFVTLQTADRHPSKPHPAMVEAAMAEAGAGAESTVIIGDTCYDMMMARNAGARAIGVSWGYHPMSELCAAGADAIARHPSDIAALIDAT